MHIFRVQNPGLSNLIQLSHLPAYRQMEWEKLTSSSEFFLLGSLSSRATRGPLWAVPVHVPDHNGRQPLIILAISADAQLHTPMYFSLANLSLTDVWFVTTSAQDARKHMDPESDLLMCRVSITTIFMLFVMLEAFLLAVMACGCYVAICHLLHYIMVMSPGSVSSLCLHPGS